MITIVVGTNRNKSISQKVAEQYQEILSSIGIESSIINLAKLPENFITSALYENAGKDSEFNIFRKKISSSEKFVFIVPEYNGSFPGVLKAFIDGMEYPRAFLNKKCALVGVSSGSQGAGLALSHLTDIFNYMGMHVLALKPKLARIKGVMTDDRVTDKLYLELLDTQARQLVDF